MQERENSPTPLKLLRMRDLKSEFGLAPASVYRWIGEGTFPVPVNIGSNSVAWHRNEIEIWLQSRPRAKVKLRTDREAGNFASNSAGQPGQGPRS